MNALEGMAQPSELRERKVLFLPLPKPFPPHSLSQELLLCLMIDTLMLLKAQLNDNISMKKFPSFWAGWTEQPCVALGRQVHAELCAELSSSFYTILPPVPGEACPQAPFALWSVFRVSLWSLHGSRRSTYMPPLEHAVAGRHSLNPHLEN